MENKQDRCVSLMKEVLKDRYFDYHIVGYELREDFEAGGGARLTCRVHDANHDEALTIEGSGVGIIDAFFSGLKGRHADTYTSLESIRFSSFQVSGKMDTGKAPASSDALAEVTLGIRNSYGEEFSFTHTSPSILRSALEATLYGVLYFVNSERAFLTIHEALKDAKAKSRQDLVTTYTQMLSELVRNTSYSEVLEEKRKEV